MSSNLINIIAAGDVSAGGGFRAAEPSQVLVEAGSTIEFKGAASGATVLSLTAATASLLSPAPASLQVQIAAGQSVIYTFGQPADQAYCCQVVASASPVNPLTCPPSEESGVLTILASDRDLPPPHHGSGG